MKLMTSGLVLAFTLFLGVSMIGAKGPPSQTGPNTNANSRARTQPQIGLQRLNRQANPHASSPAQGRGKSRSRVASTQRLARRQNGTRGKSANSNETNPAEGRRVGSREFAKDAPRIAMTRSLSKRLSQIDKIRDKALEIGDLGLLELADELELRARRKFDDMMARMEQRRDLGKPGVGPPLLLPEALPNSEPETPTTEPVVLPETQLPINSDLPEANPSDPEANLETEATTAPAATQE